MITVHPKQHSKYIAGTPTKQLLPSTFLHAQHLCEVVVETSIVLPTCNLGYMLQYQEVVV